MESFYEKTGLTPATTRWQYFLRGQNHIGEISLSTLLQLGINTVKNLQNEMDIDREVSKLAGMILKPSFTIKVLYAMSTCHIIEKVIISNRSRDS